MNDFLKKLSEAKMLGEGLRKTVANLNQNGRKVSEKSIYTKSQQTAVAILS